MKIDLSSIIGKGFYYIELANFEGYKEQVKVLK